MLILATTILTGCNKEELKTKENISKKTERIMLEKRIVTNKEIPIKEEVSEVVPKEKEEPKEIIEEKIPEPKEELPIDCIDIDTCMDITTSIQFNYQELIEDIYYLEVLEDNKKIGYFIDYTFKPYTYEDDKTCETKAKELKELLPSHIKEANCANNTLTIISYKGGIVNEDN